ncbi:hypothetical protein Agub_g7873 [Astrephomene gubernaculifera]|uniref:SRCR domain-containing protein n=1 Tax=Astrephomene gubernaculifera TaxID=47775 RepID=A0AAD3HMN8_9CHLO|nr:hypothetical protein Agub_g7873 [Astrephomene gubernaculifera]
MAWPLWLSSATFLMMLFTTDAITTALGPPPAVMYKNGIGLEQGGVLPGGVIYGRLLVSSNDPRVTNGVQGPVYRTVCDAHDFSNNEAETMCTLLGFGFGRKYYGSDATGRPGTTGRPVSHLICHNETSTHRRSLMGADDREGSSYSRQQGHSRTLTELSAYVNLPKSSGFVCTIDTVSTCPAIAPLAAVQCSNKPLPPEPSPPPSSPTAPPPKSSYLRMYGGNGYYDGTRLERNICNKTLNEDCRYWGRVEVQVAGAGGKPVWAPLCAPKSTLRMDIEQLVCLQMYDWDPVADRLRGVLSGYSSTPISIPSGKFVSKAGNFNPAQYTRWATVIGGNITTANKIQDLQLKVTAARCSTGAMLAVHCSMLVAD